MRPIHATLAAILLLAGCTTAAPEPAVHEPVTHQQWGQAQADAARVGGLPAEDKPARTMIMHASLDEVEARFGVRPHAALHQRFEKTDGEVVWLDASRDWSGVHERGILVHEAAHGYGADECEAHAIQAAWLREQGAGDWAAKVEANAREEHWC